MKISHVIYSIDNSGGGPSRSVTHLLEVVSILYPKVKLQLFAAISSDPIIKDFRSQNCDVSLLNTNKVGMLEKFENITLESPPDIYHGQAIWDLPVHQMAKVARKLNVPYIITPRGMLEPWSLQQKRFKKQLALKLYQFKDLRRAACLHATAPMEAENIRALGLKNPIAVIPNGVPLADFELKEYEKTITSKKILFLSRIHLKKGLEILIEAWSQLPAEIVQDWSIDIIGNGEAAYIKKLHNSIAEKGLSSGIQIKAPLYGKEKMQAYQNAQLFVLPTFSENFGIVVAEALACGTPVITTHGTPWKDLETHQCGWWIPIGVNPLKATLEQVLTLPINKLEVMGKNGRQLVEDQYSMEAVANQMHQLYAWILNNKKRPDFVRLY